MFVSLVWFYGQFQGAIPYKKTPAFRRGLAFGFAGSVGYWASFFK